MDYDERRLRTVNTKIEGWVERLYVDYTGQSVKKGEPMVDLYSPRAPGDAAGISPASQMEP